MVTLNCCQELLILKNSFERDTFVLHLESFAEDIYILFPLKTLVSVEALDARKARRLF